VADYAHSVRAAQLSRKVESISRQLEAVARELGELARADGPPRLPGEVIVPGLELPVRMSPQMAAVWRVLCERKGHPVLACDLAAVMETTAASARRDRAAVKVVVCHLRRATKGGAQRIETVVNVGYRLVDIDAAALRVTQAIARVMRRAEASA
jgi:DNA-binding winged helix-turn-helix (wHTH) protein